MKPLQNASRFKGEFREFRDGQLVFSNRSKSMTVPAGFSVNQMFLSDWVGKNVSVLLVDGIAVQLKRKTALVKTVKYPRDI
jgi:hypothetical protein